MDLPLHRPRGTLSTPGETVTLSAADAGWCFAGLRVLELGLGESRTIVLDGVEAAVIPLAARDVVVSVAHANLHTAEFTLLGRDGVFTTDTDWVYAPTGAAITLFSPTGGEIALATARAEEVYPIAYLAPDSYPVVVRGAGSTTRQINLQGHPDTFAGAHRLVWCEVLTPDGNWSSYPPHRHDGIGDCPWENEEIYYFRIGSTHEAGSKVPSEPGQPGQSGQPGRHGDREGFGYHRTYSAPQDPGTPIDELAQVRDGDVFLVPRGYHGPSIAAPGYPMYYLNVLAGPGDRNLNFCDDPDHAWIRNSWERTAQDPRAPITKGPTR